MPTDGTHAHGTTLSGSTAGLLGQIKSVDVDGIEVDDLDISNMDSTDKWREFMAGMKDGGELPVTLVYKSSSFNTVLGALGTSQTWTVTWPDASTMVVSGYLKSLGLPANYEEVMEQSFSIKVSGEPVFTPG